MMRKVEMAKLKKEHRQILYKLAKYLAENDSQRFGQALYNLHINEFVNVSDPEKGNYALRDIYNDPDAAILDRVKEALNKTNS